MSKLSPRFKLKSINISLMSLKSANSSSYSRLLTFLPRLMSLVFKSKQTRKSGEIGATLSIGMLKLLLPINKNRLQLKSKTSSSKSFRLKKPTLSSSRTSLNRTRREVCADLPAWSCSTGPLLRTMATSSTMPFTCSKHLYAAIRVRSHTTSMEFQAVVPEPNTLSGLSSSRLSP